ncbi:MAG: alpha/beta hydrolase domain-containing protein, partial [Gammaproteobacteria bacterium]
NARGSFNHRFAQPSRAVDRSYFYPGDQFPFSDVTQVDPATGLKDGLLEGLNPETVPKVFYTNSSTEYWRLPTALIHTTVDGTKDVQPAETSRIYLFSGTQHVPAQFPRARSEGLHVGNPNDYRWFLRSLLLSMNDWAINAGRLPPPSRYPRISDGTLVPLEQVRFPTIGHVTLPTDVSRAYRLDYGHQFESEGIITREPPGILSVFPFLVPQVDDSGNELAGLRSPDLTVPLATYTGWNPYSPIASQGSYIPFPRTQSEREKAGDVRLSIDSRYENRQHYLGLVAEAALTLIEQGYVLDGDLPEILENAGRHWDLLAADSQ